VPGAVAFVPFAVLGAAFACPFAALGAPEAVAFVPFAVLGAAFACPFAALGAPEAVAFVPFAVLGAAFACPFAALAAPEAVAFAFQFLHRASRSVVRYPSPYPFRAYLKRDLSITEHLFEGQSLWRCPSAPQFP
jgi:hypothetical protein